LFNKKMGFLDFLKPIFGSQTGVLTPTINQVAKATTGGADTFGGAFHNAVLKGGALDALDITKKAALGGLDAATKKISGVPIIGGLASGALGTAKSALESIPTTADTLGTALQGAVIR
jgi:hypothetical protein